MCIRDRQYVAPRTLTTTGFDAVSSATVLGTVKNGGEAGYSYLQMFLGETPVSYTHLDHDRNNPGYCACSLGRHVPDA